MAEPRRWRFLVGRLVLLAGLMAVVWWLAHPQRADPLGAGGAPPAPTASPGRLTAHPGAETPEAQTADARRTDGPAPSSSAHLSDGGTALLPPPPVPTLELSRGDGFVAVQLTGGPADDARLEPLPGPPPPQRRLRGRVVTKDGTPAPGAVVVVATTTQGHLDIFTDALLGEAGAVAGPEGRFTIDDAPSGAAVAVALRGGEWSALVPLPEGTEERTVELVLSPAASLEVSARVRGRPEPAEVQLERSEPPAITYATFKAADGNWARWVAPGRWTLEVRRYQGFGGASSKPVTQVLELKAGDRRRVEVDLPEGITVVVHVAAPPGPTPSLKEYWLLEAAQRPGSVAELRALAKQLPQGAVAYRSFGGQDVDALMQFDDWAAGQFTVCAAVHGEGPTQFGCDVIAAASAPLVQEFSVTVR